MTTTTGLGHGHGRGHGWHTRLGGGISRISDVLGRLGRMTSKIHGPSRALPMIIPAVVNTRLAVTGPRTRRLANRREDLV
jgi:hypothetical protein